MHMIVVMMMVMMMMMVMIMMMVMMVMIIMPTWSLTGSSVLNLQVLKKHP